MASYIEWVKAILEKHPEKKKPFIISITSADPSELSQMVGDVQELRKKLGDSSLPFSRVGVEINTSCPNIKVQALLAKCTYLITFKGPAPTILRDGITDPLITGSPDPFSARPYSCHRVEAASIRILQAK